MSEILKALSDPETQEALRQVEQLLRFLPQSPSDNLYRCCGDAAMKDSSANGAATSPSLE
jgi:hypothetical protein